LQLDAYGLLTQKLNKMPQKCTTENLKNAQQKTSKMHNMNFVCIFVPELSFKL